MFAAQSNEVGGSYHMEKEGLVRSLRLMTAKGVTLDCIVTDRHPQIQKYLRENNVTQYYDVWHFEKGIFPYAHFHHSNPTVLKFVPTQLQLSAAPWLYPPSFCKPIDSNVTAF